MKKIIIKFLMVFTGCLFTLFSYAEISLPAIVSSNMVLQRNTSISLWGWADAGENFIITASWLKNPLNISADNEGDWKVNVQTTNSKEPQSIKIKSAKQEILLENILFGEVWLCSGQSNMGMTVSGNVGQPVYGSQQAIAHAVNTNLRLFTVENQASLSPNEKLGDYKGWQSADPENVKDFSAVAYFFGKELQNILDVPVGLIHTSWGGSLIEAWMSKEVLASIKEVDLSDVDLKRGNRFPTVLFNAMINPLIPYTIKGAIWYQGEANASQPQQYKLLFPAMVKDWRNVGALETFLSIMFR